MAWRTDQAKGGFAIVSQMACQNGSANGEESDAIKQRIPLDRLDMGPSMDPFNVPLKSRFRLDKLEFSLEGPYHRLHSSFSGCGIVGVNFVEPLVKDDLHRYPLPIRADVILFYHSTGFLYMRFHDTVGEIMK